jgi:rfaE bifunctional protein kinase chain/domain
VSGHSELVRLIQRFAGLRILTWADLVVDEFVITGDPRVSREAPVLILKYKHRRLVPGGGANAAANLAALGGIPLVLGEVGDDPAGERLVSLLRESGCDTTGIFVREGRRTPRKTRFLAGDKHVALQQVLRVDRVEAFEHDDAFAARVRETAKRLAADAAGVLISDYGLGFVEPEHVSPVLAALPSRDRLKVVLDSRHRMFDFEGVDVATPSEPELEAALRRPLGESETIERAGRESLQRLKSRALILTRGSQGMMVFEQGEGTESVPAFGQGTVADVTGAGDTVIAALSLALAAGGTVAQAARIANAAAGIAVTKMGTATVTAPELVEALQRTTA